MRRILPDALPRPARLFLALAAADALLFSLLRAVFLLVFRADAAGLAAPTIARAFYLGAKFDLRLALLMNLPVLLLGGLRRGGPFDTRRGRRGWTACLAALNTAVLFVYLVDFGHYAYVRARVNVTVLQYLRDLGTSLGMVWETYPLVRGALGLALLAAAAAWLASRLLAWIGAQGRAPGGARWRPALATALTVLVAAAGIYGKLSWYPLRWSDAYFSTSGFAADLALNPVLYFAETVKKKPAAYDLEAVRRHYPLMARYLGVAAPDPQRLRYARRTVPRSVPARRPNVVIVLLESFAAHKTGVFGNPLDPTPHFDALAKRGLLFTRFFTPTWGTARSVFATVTGLPDVESHQTATRNPLLVAQHTILNDFAGYAKFYFLGGSLNWANIRGLLSANIEGLQLHEEGSFSAPRVDVWGISDLHLFEEASRVFSRQRGPFVAVVQTSGSHRPYTIPADSRGFQGRRIADAEAARHGFVSAAEYNAFRFLDHGIGRFIELASREPWFADTVFLFYGDHGLPGTAPHIPRAEEALLLTRFHVPLLILAPGLVPAGERADTVASELDVLPTAAALAGVPHLNTTLGRDLLDPAYDASRYAFTIGDQSTSPQVGLVGPEHYFQMFADGSRKGLFALRRGRPGENLIGELPEVAAGMEELCRALYETARYLPYVNAPGRMERPAGAVGADAGASPVQARPESRP